MDVRPPLFRRYPRIALSVLVAIAQSALAQQVPDAGRLLEQLQPVPVLPQREPPSIQVDEPPILDLAEGELVPVVRLRINGATRFGEAELHTLVAEGEGRRLSLDALNQLAARITRYYRSQGYLLARAYLPAQDIVDGEVTIAVVEGRLGQVALNNATGLGGWALAPLNQLRSETVIENAALERSLLLLSDLPGVDVQSTLKPGTTVGASDLLVDVAAGREVDGGVDFDSFGDRFSGQFRLGGTWRFNNPLHIGDQASLRAIGSDQGMRYLRAAYQLPITKFGTRIGVAASQMHYRLGSTLAVLHASGESTTGSVYALHPFIRSRSFNLNGEFQYDRKTLGDRIDATSTVIGKTLVSQTAGISGDFVDGIGGIGGGGSNSFSISYTSGHLDLDAESLAIDQAAEKASGQTSDRASARTAGHFSKIGLSWLRLQRLTGAASLYVSATAQFAGKNLDSSEKISLGGANGIRAYPQGEASGDEGYLVTLEGRYNLSGLQLVSPGLWQLSLFADRGRVKINKNDWGAATNHRSLAALGFGLNLSQAAGWMIKASLAWKLGAERPTSDVDRSPMAWLQVIKSFPGLP